MSARKDTDFKDKSALPKPLQVREFGKRSQSKWTHLTAEDTTAFGRDATWSKESTVTKQLVSKMGGMHSSLQRPTTKRRKI